MISLGVDLGKSDDAISRLDEPPQTQHRDSVHRRLRPYRGTGRDLSSGGICFDADIAIPFEVKFDANGGTKKYRAHLAWMKPLGKGRSQLLFKFVPGRVVASVVDLQGPERDGGLKRTVAHRRMYDALDTADQLHFTRGCYHWRSDYYRTRNPMTAIPVEQAGAGETAPSTRSWSRQSSAENPPTTLSA